MRTRPQRPTQTGQNEQDGRPTRELFEHLARKANRGDQSALQRLRERLERNPDIPDAIADLTRHIENSLIALVSRGSLVLAESLRVKTKELRRSLRDEGGETTAEALLVDQVVLTWLEVHFVAMAAIQPQQHRGDARFWQQRYDRASQRHARAIEELATVRGPLEKDAPPARPVRPPSLEPALGPRTDDVLAALPGATEGPNTRPTCHKRDRCPGGVLRKRP